MKSRLLSASTMMTTSVSPIALGATCALLLCVTLGVRPTHAADSKLERGEYLVNTSGCHDCHTPLMMGNEVPEPEVPPMASSAVKN